MRSAGVKPEPRLSGAAPPATRARESNAPESTARETIASESMARESMARDALAREVPGPRLDRTARDRLGLDGVRDRAAPSAAPHLGGPRAAWAHQAQAISPGRVALEKIAAAATDPSQQAAIAALATAASPQALDDAAVRALTAAVHWVTWSKGAWERLPEGPQRAALGAARSEIFAAVARLGDDDFDARVVRAGQLLDGYSALTDPYVTQKVAPEGLAQLFSWFSRPGLHEALCALGRGKKRITHFHQSEQLALALSRVSAAFAHLPEGSAAALVQQLGASTDAALAGGQFGAALHIGDLGRAARNLLRGEVDAALGARFRAVAPAVQESVVDTVASCPSAAVLPTLSRLLAAPWFKAATTDTQRVLAFCLGYAAHVAERSGVEAQRRLLTNTVDRILSGAIAADARDLGEQQLYGLARASTAEITLNSAVYALTESLAPTAELRHLALHTLAHEVSHVLSGQGVERSVAYFEEEYRAFSVGFLAEFGRLPNAREGAEHAAYLLTAKDGAYAYIAEGLRRTPARFAAHLEALGLDAFAAVRGSAADLKRAAAQQSTDTPAPQWGWAGYAANEPKVA